MTFDDIQALDDTVRIWPLRNTALGISGSARMMEGSICMMPPCSVELSRIQQTNQIGSTPPPGTASWHWCGALISTCCGSARAARSWSPAMSRPMLSLVIALLLLGVGRLSAYAATFYVSAAGANSVTCAQAQNAQTPRRTINAGIACLAGGDTLIVKAGTYDEIVTDFNNIGGYTVRVPSGLSWSSPTTIKAETAGAVTLRVTSPPSGWTSIIEFDSSGTTSQYILIEGFVLDCQFFMTLGIGVTASNHLRFKDLEIKNSRGQGIQGDCVSCEFLNLYVHHTARNNGKTTCPSNTCDNPPGELCAGFCHAVYLTGTGNIIDGGSFHDSDGHAIHLYPGPSNNIVRNIYAYNNKVGIGIYGGGHQVYNNVLQNNQLAIWTGRGNTIAHNTIYGWQQLDGNESFGIYDNDGGTVIKNNLVLNQRVNSLRGYIYVNGGSGPSGNRLADSVDPAFVSGNLCDDPTMLGCAVAPASSSPVVNAGAPDFHLRAGSPAIAAGVPLPNAAMKIDKDGVARPPTGAVDIGAYQYISGGQTIPPPSNLRAKVP